MIHHYSRRTHCKNGHEFTEDNTLRRGNERVCRACKREHQRGRKGEQKVNQRRRAEENRHRINEYLRLHPCADCGETDIVVLEFDHVRGRKLRDVCGMVLNSWKRILKEIAKCDVVCANDHTRRTAQRANTLRWRER